MSETTVKEKIREATGESQSTSVDGMSVSQRRISELIEADKYLAETEAATGKPKRMGLRMGVLRAPGHF
jgi:hypothetical protein